MTQILPSVWELAVVHENKLMRNGQYTKKRLDLQFNFPWIEESIGISTISFLENLGIIKVTT